MMSEWYERPITHRQLARIRVVANAPVVADEEWPNSTVKRLIAEIDRLTYMVWRGGPDELITGEDGHLIINGSHGCAPELGCGGWYPPPAESWTLPT